MKRWFVYPLSGALVLALTTGLAASPANNSSQTQSSATASKSHGTFSVELVKGLDSKKLKQGDEVEAKLTGGITLPNGTPVSRGTKIIGHVTEAKARSKSDSESSLGISFDKIVRAPGEEVPIKGVIQAVAPNPNAAPPDSGLADSYHNLKDVTTKSVMTPSGAPTPVLNDQSVGVLGIKNMQLGPDGVLTSTAKEVKLDSGTRMMLDVTMQ